MPPRSAAAWAISATRSPRRARPIPTQRPSPLEAPTTTVRTVLPLLLRLRVPSNVTLLLAPRGEVVVERDTRLVEAEEAGDWEALGQRLLVAPGHVGDLDVPQAGGPVRRRPLVGAERGRRAPHEELGADQLRAHVQPWREPGLAEDRRVGRVDEDLVAHRGSHVPARPQDVDAVVGVAWMPEEALLLLVPRIDAVPRHVHVPGGVRLGRGRHAVDVLGGEGVGRRGPPPVPGGGA